MAKNALGKGLGALLGDNPAAAEEVAVSTGKLAKGQGSVPAKPKNIPDCVEVDDNGGLWANPELFIPNPKQMRQDFNQKQLDELCASIQEKGILEPIVVEYIEESGKFYIIAGERRTRAAKAVGLKKVPVVLRKFDDQQKLEFALIENIQRANLNPIEEATAYYNLIQMSDLSQDEVAKRVGKNRSTVANAIRLLKLPEDVQRSLMSGQISSGHARALLMLKNDADMRVLFGKIVGSGLSVREAEALAGDMNNGSRAASKKTAKKVEKKDADVLNFEQELRNIFGIRDVNLKGDVNKGSIVIGFDSNKDFERIYEILLKK